MFAFWFDHNMETGLTEEEISGMRAEYKARKVLVDESDYYKDTNISTPGSNFSATKLPSDLAAMSITSS